MMRFILFLVAALLASQAPAQDAKTLRVYFERLTLELRKTCPNLKKPASDPPTGTKTSFKGWELYVWHQDGDNYFALLPGTNRLKTDAEIAAAAVKGIDTIKPELDQLKAGEIVFVRGKRLATLTK
jgi:hypothetical protein